MRVANKILVGIMPNMGGLKMYREALPSFSANCVASVTNDGLAEGSVIVVNYVEYVENELGQKIPELIKTKKYVLKDYEDFKPVTVFYNSLWRTVTASDRGLAVQIENVISKLHFNVEDGHVVSLQDLA